MTELFKPGFIEKELRWWNVPGVSIGVVRTDESGHGTVVFSGGFGLRDIENSLPMTGNSLGGIASCSKAFTAAVIASLVDEGILDFDRPVREYIPYFRLMDEFASKECCLRDMLYHRTGIAAHDAMWPQPGQTAKEYIERVRHLAPNKPFRSISQYNNTIYNLAGLIAQEASGIPYETLVHERILKPLGMDRTVLTLKQMQADADWAPGYFAEDVGVTPPQKLRRMEGWDMSGVGAPAAGVNSCASDMLKWITLHLNNGVYEGKRLFSENVMRQMHDAAVKMSPFPWRTPEIPGFGLYGMGWKTAIYRGMRMIYHCGEIEGYCSITTFLPDHNVGMFVLCNRHTMLTPFMAELVYTAYDSVLDLDYIDWAERLHPYAHDFTGSCYTWGLDLMPSPEGKPDTKVENRSDCAGSYESSAYGAVTIVYGSVDAPVGVSYMADGKEPSPAQLYLHFKEWVYPLEACEGLGENVFRIRNLKEDTLFYTIPLEFLYDEQGNVNAFTLKLEKETAPILFTKTR